MGALSQAPFERDFSLNSVVILNIPRHLESKIYLTSSTQTQTGQKEAGAQDVEVVLGSNSHNTNVHTVAQFWGTVQINEAIALYWFYQLLLL